MKNKKRNFQLCALVNVISEIRRELQDLKTQRMILIILLIFFGLILIFSRIVDYFNHQLLSECIDLIEVYCLP